MLHSRHLNDWNDFSQEEFFELFSLALEVKNNPKQFAQSLKDQVLISLFEKTSTRTRTSSELSIREMGGHSLVFDLQKTNIGLTKIEYETEYLSSHAQFIMARLLKNDDILAMMKRSHASIINGCCNRYHPLQALADMITLYQNNNNSFENSALLYCGKYNNVTNSLKSICVHTGVKLYFYCVNEDDAVIDQTSLDQLKSRGLFHSVINPQAVIDEVQFIYTDTWINMELFQNEQSKKDNENEIELMLPYQINKAMIQDKPIKIMHDMPIHPGYEIAEELVYDQRSIIFEQAKNRLPAQKAVLLYFNQQSKNK